MPTGLHENLLLKSIRSKSDDSNSLQKKQALPTFFIMALAKPVSEYVIKYHTRFIIKLMLNTIYMRNFEQVLNTFQFLKD